MISEKKNRTLIEYIYFYVALIFSHFCQIASEFLPQKKQKMFISATF